MMREILDVRRCTTCQEVVQAFVMDVYNQGAEDEQIVYVWLPRRTHSRDDCDRMVRLAAEEWPTLF